MGSGPAEQRGGLESGTWRYYYWGIVGPSGQGGQAPLKFDSLALLVSGVRSPFTRRRPSSGHPLPLPPPHLEYPLISPPYNSVRCRHDVPHTYPIPSIPALHKY